MNNTFPQAVSCHSWSEIRDHLEKFPNASITPGSEGEFLETQWVFRGHSKASYKLAPTIERALNSMFWPWSAVEVFILREFKARARLHVPAAVLPDDDLGWQALMQHYAVPTRLLDFTYSPFIALYFAIRNGITDDGEAEPFRVWAMDAVALQNRFLRVVRDARQRLRERSASAAEKERIVSSGLYNFSDEYDSITDILKVVDGYIKQCLNPDSGLRRELNNTGCACVSRSSYFNPRQANQQGVFLINCDRQSSLEISLHNMMRPITKRGDVWCRVFDIDAKAADEVERELFKMNIHEQSLFPDIEGLAGLIRQNVRLHWG